MTKKRCRGPETWYSFYDDWDLIEASIASQYGRSIRKEIKTLTWAEVKVMILGLLPETPLGKMVQIRSENDKKALKNYTPEMRKIRSDWRNRRAKEMIVDQDSYDKRMHDLEVALANAFGNK